MNSDMNGQNNQNMMNNTFQPNNFPNNQGGMNNMSQQNNQYFAGNSMGQPNNQGFQPNNFPNNQGGMNNMSQQNNQNFAGNSMSQPNNSNMINNVNNTANFLNPNTSNLNRTNENNNQILKQSYKKQGKKNNLLKGIIIAVVCIFFLAIIGGLMNKDKENNTNTTSNYINDNNNSNDSSSYSNDKIVAFNTYSNIDKKVQMKVTGSEPSPEDSQGDSMYYYIYVSIKNESSEKVIIASTYESNVAAFVNFSGNFVMKGSDLNNLTDNDIKLHPCRVKEVTLTNGETIEVNLHLKENILIASGEEVKALLSCAITEKGRAKGVIPVILTTYNLDNSIIKNFSLVQK